MRKCFWMTAPLVWVIGCTGTESDDPLDDTAVDDQSEVFASFINVEVEPVGDFTGFEGCSDYNTCDWFQQSVDDSRQQDAAMDGQT